jgi:hypothetical protein
VTDKLRARDWRVERVEHRLVRQFMRAEHYAGGAGNTSVFAHGLVPAVGGELRGAAVWLPPMRPAAQYVARHLDVPVDRVLCLSRLAVHPDVPTNGASFLMGRAIRDIRRDGRWDALVTWADTRLGHTGAIYRATNWTYMGTTRPRRLWVDATGRLMSTRAGRPHARRNLTKAECEARGWVQTAPSWKHRFVMRLR